MSVTITLDNRFVRVDGAGLKELRAIDAVCSYKVAGYFFSPAYKSRRWDGKEHLFKFTKSRGYHAPSGMAEDIARELKKRGVDYRVKFETKLKGKPKRFKWNPSVKLRGYQNEAVAAALGKPIPGRCTLKMPIRSGKALAQNEPVLTVNGWKAIGSLTVGDWVYGSDGLPTRVTGVFPQGVKELFKIIFDDGSWSICCADHLWTFDVMGRDKRADGSQPWIRRRQTRPLKEWARRKSLRLLRLPTVAIRRSPRKLPIEPYTLGVLLGNGHLKGTPTVTLNEADAADIAAGIGHPGTTLTRDLTKRPGCVAFRFSGKQGRANSLSQALGKLGLLGLLSGEKSIPKTYLLASIDQRLALLAGLVDTDGSACRAGAHYHTTSKRLAQDVLSLARSVGCRASLGHDKCWRVTMRHSTERLFRTARKLAAQTKPVKRRTVDKYVKRIEPYGKGPAVCISIEAEDGLFVTRGFTLTHNTKTVARILWKLGRPGLFVVPSRWILNQTIKSLRECMPDAPIGQIGDGVFDVQFFTVATIQSLAAMAPQRADKRKGKPGRDAHPEYARLMNSFDVGVFDECFVAGTQVDGRCIEDIAVGDVVTSFDPQMRILKKRVTRVFKRRPRALVRVSFSDGRSIVCTPEHPVKTTMGWVSAGALDVRHVAYSITCHDEVFMVQGKEDRPEVSFLGPKKPPEENGPSVLLEKMRTGLYGINQLAKRALAIGSYAQGFVQSHEAEQPNERPTGAGGNGHHASGHGSLSENARRQREPTPAARSGSSSGARLADRASSSRRTRGAETRTSDQLQAGHSESRAEDRNRSRRILPCFARKAATGPQKTTVPGTVRVDRVEVLERGSDGRFGGMCPDGFVYNLEVEDTHTYVANGIAVHNCHHLTGQGDWYRVFVDLNARFKIGVSATIFFDNTKEVENGIIWLRATCGPIRYEVSAGRLIREGYLLPQHVKMYRVKRPLGERRARWSQTHKRACITENQHRNDLIADIVASHTVAADKPKKTIVIANEHAHINAICEALDTAGVEFRTLTGKTSTSKREAAVEDFLDGRFHVLVGNVLGEGVDIPDVEVVVNAEGGQDEKKTWQRQRNLTVVEGSSKVPVMIDFYDEMSAIFERHSKKRLKVYKSEKEFKAEVLDWKGAA